MATAIVPVMGELIATGIGVVLVAMIGVYLVVWTISAAWRAGRDPGNRDLKLEIRMLEAETRIDDLRAQLADIPQQLLDSETLVI